MSVVQERRGHLGNPGRHNWTITARIGSSNSGQTRTTSANSGHCVRKVRGSESVDGPAASTQLSAGSSVGPDFNNDGTVDILDLLALLANWGPCA